MAKFERYEPRGDSGRALDDEEFDEEEEEGSRLPLLLVIGLLVVAAFAGVVWLAYTQGVQRGRADAPRMLVGADGSGRTMSAPGDAPFRGMKIYQQPAPADDEDADSPPQAPTPKTDTATDDEAPATLAPKQTPVPPAPTAKVAKAPVEAADVVTQPVAIEPAHSPQTNAKALVVPAEKPAAPAKVAVAANPPPVRAAAEVPAAGGDVALQIGAYKTQAEADAAREAFARKHPVAAGYPFAVKEADLGEKGIWYRLRLGAFSDKTAALAFCDKLKTDGGTCFLAR